MFTLKGVLKRAGFRHGEHYLEVPARQVFEENELELFAHRRNVFKHGLASTAAIASAGAAGLFGPRPLKIAATTFILFEIGRMTYHATKQAESFKARKEAWKSLPQIHSRLREYAKEVNLDGPVSGAAFTIGGGKIFFLNKEARDHLKKRRWSIFAPWTKTNFSFD